MRVILTGGATAGHVTPFEPIVDALRVSHEQQRDELPWAIQPKKLEIFFWGVANAQTRAFFAGLNVPVSAIPAGKLRRYASALNAIDLLLRFPLGLTWALLKTWWGMPDVVISKGGYGSLPVTLAARLYRIPVILHESDSTPGLANKIASRFAAAVALSFRSAATSFDVKPEKIVVTGTPVRRGFGEIDSAAAKRHFGFPATEKVVLVTGGSQGAQQLNEVLLKVLPRLITEVGIVHIAGEKNFTAVSTVAKELLSSSPRSDMYKIYPYLSEMPQAMAAADVIVGRAGATTLAEIARSRTPCVLIPLLNAANDHQRKNAALFERAGAARVLDAANLRPSLFEQSVRRLLNDQTVRGDMAQRLAEFDAPHAGAHVANIAFRLVTGLPVQQQT